MKVLVEYPSSEEQTYEAYRITDLSTDYKLIEIQDHKLREKKEKGRRLEMDHRINLGEIRWENIETLQGENRLLVTFGMRPVSPMVWGYYHLHRQKWEQRGTLVRQQEGRWISCYGEKQCMASDILLSLLACITLAHQINSQLVVIGDFESELPYYRQNSLLLKAMSQMLEENNGLMFMTKGNPSEDTEVIYHLTGSEPRRLKQILSKIEGNNEEVSDHLFSDLYYSRMKEETPLYIPLRRLEQDEAIKLKQLQLSPLTINSNLQLLSMTKKELEEKKYLIRPYLYSELYTSLLTPCHLESFEEENKAKAWNLNTKYLGKEVYIGMLGTQEEIEALLEASWSGKIDCIWRQEQGGQGYYLSKAGIKRRMSERGTKEKMGPKGLGEYLERVHQVAPEAHFLLAQLQTAPREVQLFFDNKCTVSNVLLADIVIAAHRLVEIAHLNRRPLVLLIPYCGFLDFYSENNPYIQSLERLGNEPGCILVLPTGEEGDQGHNFTFHPEGNIDEIIQLESKQVQEKLVGNLLFRQVEAPNLVIYGDGASLKEPIWLEEAGHYQRGEYQIYTSGAWQSKEDAMTRIEFSITPFPKGKMTMRLQGRGNKLSTIRYHLAPTGLNPFVKLRPTNIEGTINSLCSIQGAISVGGIDEIHQTLRGSSGRGMTFGEKSIMPSFAMEGSSIGAASMVGILALLLDKWQQERGSTLPTSKMLKEYLMHFAQQDDLKEYPHLGEGYGKILIKDLRKIFERPFE